MIEDKLAHDERLRLECLAQAIAFNAAVAPGQRTALPSTRDTLERARQFEVFVTNGGTA